VAIDVRLSDRECRLFWPMDLEEISSMRPSGWRALLGRGGAA
jgi:hypothetical protein